MKKTKLEVIFGNKDINELGGRCAALLKEICGGGRWIHSLNDEEKALANLMGKYGLLYLDILDNYFKKTEKGGEAYKELKKYFREK